MTSILPEDDGQATLSLSCRELVVDDTIRAAGHEPNGYFWEAIATHLLPGADLEYDPEANTFYATGSPHDVTDLAAKLGPLTTDPDGIRTIAAAETAGVEFDE